MFFLQIKMTGGDERVTITHSFFTLNVISTLSQYLHNVFNQNMSDVVLLWKLLNSDPL